MSFTQRFFGGSAAVRTDGKLIALVGPNEAGKTSLLTAVSRHGLANKFVDGDASRFKDQPPTVTLRYFLTAEEAQAAGIPQPGWMNVTRSSDNTYTVELKPPPNRNLDKRRNCQAALELAIKSYAMTEFESMPWELTPETYEALLDETDLYSAE